MVMQVLDFAEGHVPTTADHIFADIIMLIMMLPSLYLLFLYIMRALGLYRIAKRRGIHHSWLAWIPCGKDWLLGSISDHYRYFTDGKKHYARIFLLLISLPAMILSFFSNAFSFVFPLLFMDWDPSAPLTQFLLDSRFAEIIPFLIRLSPYLMVLLLISRLFPTYQLYRSALPRYRRSLLILNVLIPFSPAVAIFAVRNYDMGMPPRRSIS